jgi:hypothetical protein
VPANFTLCVDLESLPFNINDSLKLIRLESIREYRVDGEPRSRITDRQRLYLMGRLSITVEKLYSLISLLIS